VLENLSVEIPAGAHVAIIGRSGAGKSSLVGLLLGWHVPASGEVRVDGEPLTSESIEGFRRECAWLDPEVQLWNRSLLDNLAYGGEGIPQEALRDALTRADLMGLLERLPDGLQTPLGEGGGRLSGGEGQRVRWGRASLRADARMAILDEPFRGLDREKRRELLGRARSLWRNATMLCVTHDVSETRDFDRVLVVEDGKLIEDGSPEVLLKQPKSRFRVLFEADERLRKDLWSGKLWKRLWLADGQITPSDPPETGGAKG
jgi:ATP-binding cassette subfamily B protein